MRLETRWADIDEEEDPATSIITQVPGLSPEQHSRWSTRPNDAWSDKRKVSEDNVSVISMQDNTSFWVNRDSWNQSAKAREWFRSNRIHTCRYPQVMLGGPGDTHQLFAEEASISDEALARFCKISHTDGGTDRGGIDSGMVKKDLRWDNLGKQFQRFANRLQCQFIIGIEEDPQFRVGRRLLGSHGQIMKYIADKTSCRLRLWGRGSRFLKGPNQQESPDSLMLCISSLCANSHNEAARFYAEYLEFCQENDRPVPDLQIRRTEGRRRGSR